MVVITALAAVGTAIAASAFGAAIGIAGVTSTLALAAIGLATNVVLGMALNALTPKPSGGSNRGYQVNSRGSALDHQIIYGKVRVGGAILYDEATGTDNKYLHRIIGVAGHEVTSFDEIYINDELATTDLYGNVTSPSRYNNKVRINFHSGSSDQSADVNLVSESAKWTSAHRLRGIAYMYVRFAFDADVFPNGVPVITATVKGKKVYNPSTGLTAWSDNPALCLRDYLTTSTYGLGEVAANIDDTLVIASAAVCNETNTIVGTTRYTCNGAFTTAVTPYDMINSLLTSMGGSLWYSQGKWRMKPSYWTTPVLFLNEDDLRSPVGVSTRHSRRDNFNAVKGTFRGEETNWQVTDYPEVTNAAFVTADNGQVSVVDIDLAFTDNSIEARRISRIALESNRQQLMVSASFGLRALGVQVGDNIYLTNSRFGWVNKAFQVISWTFGLTDGLDLQVEMMLKETAESVFDEVDDGVVYERDNTNLLSAFDVPIPSLDAAVVLTSVNEDGTTIPSINFSWSVVEEQLVDHYDFQWKPSTDTLYSSVTITEPNFTLSPALSGIAYDYRVRSVNTLGVNSIFVSSVSAASTGNDSTIPNPPTGLSASAGYGAVTVTWTAPTTNVGGSPLKDLFQYEIYRGTSSNPTVKVGVVASNIFTDGGLSDNTTYYYRVKAVDFTGNLSAYSIEGSATTNPTLVDGTDGLNNATVFLYNKSSSATPPALFSGTFLYTFSTGVLSGGTLNGWSQEPPTLSQGDNLWVSLATASSRTATDSIPTAEFSTPEITGVAGTDGADGANTARVSLFRKTTTATAPADPSGTFTYTFATGVLSGGTFNSWSQSAPSINNGEYLWVIQASAFSSNATDTIAASEFTPASIVGIGGTNGNPAKLLVLNATDQVFTFDENNVADPTSQTITFTAFLENTDDTTATWSSSPSVTLTGTGNTRSLSVANFGANTSVTITASADSGAVSDTFTVYRLKEGAAGAAGADGAAGEDALTLILSNEAHTFAADAAGVVASYSGSGTTIKLFEGTTELIYQQGSTLNSRWSISTSPSNITVGSITDSGNFATVNNHSNMTQDTASIVYTITGKRADGSAINLTKTQSFSKSKVGAAGAAGADGTEGADGERGAGRWNIGVTNLPTTSSGANTAFVAAIGAPVDRDQAWFYTGTQSAPTSQSVWIYNAGTLTWVQQTEVIDGNLIVSGTITADRLESNQIATLGLTIGTLSSSPSGERTVIEDDRISVYDASNVLRVRLGRLT